MNNRMSELIDRMADAAAKMSPEDKKLCAGMAKNDVAGEKLSPRFEAIFGKLHGKQIIIPQDSTTQEIAQGFRDQARRVNDENTRQAALTAPMHLYFFTAVDRKGVTRFFDIMQGNEVFSVAETATTAPRLAQCRESVYEVPENSNLHHVHRNYGSYKKTEKLDANLVMHQFAKACGLTRVTKIAETINQLQALPTWDEIFQKLGCSTRSFSFKSVCNFSE